MNIMIKRYYILVADSSRAKVFKSKTPINSLELIYDQVNYDGRKKPSELYSDRSGMQRSGTMGMHSYAGDQHDHEEESFARELCRMIKNDCEQDGFDRLVLIAPPRFLGELRRHLDQTCIDKLDRCIDKDLVKMTDKNLVEYLAR